MTNPFSVARAAVPGREQTHQEVTCRAVDQDVQALEALERLLHACCAVLRLPHISLHTGHGLAPDQHRIRPTLVQCPMQAHMTGLL